MNTQALMHSEPYVHALGALTGNMAMQQAHNFPTAASHCI